MERLINLLNNLHEENQSLLRRNGEMEEEIECLSEENEQLKRENAKMKKELSSFGRI